MNGEAVPSRRDRLPEETAFPRDAGPAHQEEVNTFLNASWYQTV